MIFIIVWLLVWFKSKIKIIHKFVKQFNNYEVQSINKDNITFEVIVS